jgi:hypothetical protein
MKKSGNPAEGWGGLEAHNAQKAERSFRGLLEVHDESAYFATVHSLVRLVQLEKARKSKLPKEIKAILSEILRPILNFTPGPQG